jgi:acylglycerol lipase
MTTRIEGELTAADQTSLFLRTWPVDEPKGIVLFVHGLGEHGDRYAELAGVVNEAGFAAAAADHRGHGRSGGLRGHVNGFGEYVHDLRLVIDHVREAQGSELPLYVYGHSMGGLIALLLVVDPPDAGISGLVVSNALLQVAVKAPPIKVFVGKLVSSILPKLRLDNELKVEHISRDPAEVKKYSEDPLVGRLISTRWYTSMMTAMAKANARPADLKLPSLWVVSGSDQICAHEAGLVFEKASTGPSEVTLLPDAYHEPHNGPDRGLVHEAVVKWLSGQLAARG